jgi:hypothetical protein
MQSKISSARLNFKVHTVMRRQADPCIYAERADVLESHFSFACLESIALCSFKVLCFLNRYSLRNHLSLLCQHILFWDLFSSAFFLTDFAYVQRICDLIFGQKRPWTASPKEYIYQPFIWNTFISKMIASISVSVNKFKRYLYSESISNAYYS